VSLTPQHWLLELRNLKSTINHKKLKQQCLAMKLTASEKELDRKEISRGVEESKLEEGKLLVSIISPPNWGFSIFLQH
jgi:hypothetical protein